MQLDVAIDCEETLLTATSSAFDFKLNSEIHDFEVIHARLHLYKSHQKSEIQEIVRHMDGEFLTNHGSSFQN